VNPYFTMQDILTLYKDNSELNDINSHIEQKHE
jgi:spore coat polysaccharide biosynthesis protein SpsF (cytidylyltransferase family)